MYRGTGVMTGNEPRCLGRASRQVLTYTRECGDGMADCIDGEAHLSSGVVL